MKNENNRLKRIILRKILLDKTDEQHAITLSDIIDELALYDISAERKSLYKDIKLLENTGIKILRSRVGRETYYQVVEREFEVAELKLLVDAIQSSRFISEKKSNELIGKLEKFASEYDAEKLDRQVYIVDRIKTINESVYSSVDLIHVAIAENKQISFQYFSWNIKKKMEYRHDGIVYEISPWGLIWNDEYYYLVGYDKKDEIMKHFRVDKIVNAKIVNSKREGKNLLKTNMVDYSNYHFGMYGGERRIVRLLVANDKAGVIIDRFGKGISIVPYDDNTFVVDVKVAVSNMFLGWIFGLGDSIEILLPEDIREYAIEELEKLRKKYKKKS